MSECLKFILLKHRSFQHSAGLPGFLAAPCLVSQRALCRAIPNVIGCWLLGVAQLVEAKWETSPQSANPNPKNAEPESMVLQNVAVPVMPKWEIRQSRQKDGR